MIIVYVVTAWYIDSEETIGVYATREKAEVVARAIEALDVHYQADITDYELDKYYPPMD